MADSEGDLRERASGIYFPPHNWVAGVFERGYPFEVWEERIKSLDVERPLVQHLYGVSEAVLFLADSYATTLAASLINPSFRWLAVERFASSGLIGFIARLLGSEDADDAWRKLMEHPDFIRIASAKANLADKSFALSILVGNPARIDSQGKVSVRYDPGALRELVASALRFRTDNRRILNAVKHGFRLPMYKAEELDSIVADIRASHSHSGDVRDPDELREHIERSGVSPAFWLLQTPEDRNRRSGMSVDVMNASLTLYGVSHCRAVQHCRLLLDLLRLLFDTKRESASLKDSASAVGRSPFEAVLTRICWMPLPMILAEDEDAHIVRGYVPDDRRKQHEESEHSAD
jgi:hypothetical protein